MALMIFKYSKKNCDSYVTIFDLKTIYLINKIISHHFGTLWMPFSKKLITSKKFVFFLLLKFEMPSIMRIL